MPDGGKRDIQRQQQCQQQHGAHRLDEYVGGVAQQSRAGTHWATLGHTSTENDKLRQAIMLMEKNITTPLEIAVNARLVETSSRQLERGLLAETGASPSEFYRNSYLKYGRWLLTTSDSPVSAIAYECGFADASHFIRHFQQLYGVAPGRLRRAVMAA
nr:helix-turn-helix domain-containing protein [uncultured Albidiferax sp.]